MYTGTILRNKIIYFKDVLISIFVDEIYTKYNVYLVY